MCIFLFKVNINMCIGEMHMEKDKHIHIRINEDEKEEMLKKANKLGFKQLSEYLRFLGLNATVDVKIKDKV